MLKRNQAEILKRIEERKKNDFFGFETGDYIDYLTFKNAKPFLVEGITEEEWKVTEEDPIDQIKQYMDFAWDKANEKRGLSANRSIAHMVAWLWLAGEDELAAWADDESNYYHYGKPILQKICEHYELDWKQWDNGERTNGEE